MVRVGGWKPLGDKGFRDLCCVEWLAPTVLNAYSFKNRRASLFFELCFQDWHAMDELILLIFGIVFWRVVIVTVASAIVMGFCAHTFDSFSGVQGIALVAVSFVLALVWDEHIKTSPQTDMRLSGQRQSRWQFLPARFSGLSGAALAARQLIRRSSARRC